MLLLIAYGNPLRQDDGAGWLLADRLEQACGARGIEVRRLSVQQLLPELAVDIAADDIDAVIFSDARPAEHDRAAVAVRALAPGLGSPALGHHLTPEIALAYAGQLFGHCPPAWLLTVPGVEFSHGEQISPVALAALAGADQVISVVLNSFQSEERSEKPGFSQNPGF